MHMSGIDTAVAEHYLGLSFYKVVTRGGSTRDDENDETDVMANGTR